jgi:2-polyprenyl-3-methyl-5-hydroxy-6-metoxy-1,4-benzoquinol methylase
LKLDTLYSTRFPEADRASKDAIWRVLCQHFLQRYISPADTVLDLGAGFGEFLRHVRCARRVAVDIEMLPGRSVPPGTQEIFVSSDQLSTKVAPESIDVVFCSNFLEHLPDKETFLTTLAEIRTVLRPGGRLLVLQPNIRLIGGAYWDFVDHHLPLTHRTLIEACDSLGFDIVEVIPRFLPYTTRSRLPQSPWLVRLYLAFRPAWWVFGRQTWFVARKPFDMRNLLDVPVTLGRPATRRNWSGVFFSRALAALTDYEDTRSLGARFRARRAGPLLHMIDALFLEHGFVSIVDVGGTEAYWKIVPERFLEDRKVHITIVNLPGALRATDHGRFTFITGDGCDLAFLGDRSFHIAHSNSVVEHVGDWARMVRLATELTRLSSRTFVQTPNYWFPVEPHCMTPFFHWLPKPLRVWLVRHFRLGHWAKATSTDEAVRLVESARLLNRAMLQELFKDAHIVTERFVGLPKSLIAIRM